MSEEDKGTSGAPEQSASGEAQEKAQQEETKPSSSGEAESKSGDSVSYDTYRKILAEKKKADEERRRLQEEREAWETQRLESEGKKDELIESLKSQIKKKDEMYKSRVSSFVNSRLEDQVRAEAAQMGCIDPDAVVKLADISQIQMDEETLQADKEHVKLVLDELKQERSYLFSKKAPNVNTSPPSTDAPDPKKVDLSKLSVEELKQLAHKQSLANRG